MNETARRWLVIAILIAVAAAAYFFFAQRQVPTEPVSGPVEPPVSAPAGPRHPIEAVERPAAEADDDAAGTSELPPLPDSDGAVEEALSGVLSREAVLGVVSVGDHIPRFVATVDNLPRKQAPSRIWPVNPTPGRFTVEEEDGRSWLSTENYRRYTPFVDLATSVDAASLVALYVRFYPLLQEAYEELGYPGKHFNDRLVDVIDHLLAAPEPRGRIELVLPELDPSVEVERPWVLYRYADPTLQSLSAGQKILIRMGSDNAGRLKAQLRELRSRLGSTPPAVTAAPDPGT